MERFGEKLRALRKQNNMSLQSLAHELGIKSHSYISALETSKKHPSVELLVKVARLFSVSTDQLINDDLECS